MIFISIFHFDFSVFGFVQLTVAVEWILLNPYDRKYLSLKTASAYIFSTNNRKLNSLQPLAALENLDPAANHKHYMTPLSETLMKTLTFLTLLSVVVTNDVEHCIDKKAKKVKGNRYSTFLYYCRFHNSIL